MNDPKSRGSRRAFLERSGAVAAGLYAGNTARANVDAGKETLAIHGGPKAVTWPADTHRDASRWPRYGTEEERAVLDVLKNPGYSQNAALERDWKALLDAPHVRSYC